MQANVVSAKTPQPLHPMGKQPTSLKASYDAGIGSAAHGIRSLKETQPVSQSVLTRPECGVS
jgi:hypothetical protein